MTLPVIDTIGKAKEFAKTVKLGDQYLLSDPEKNTDKLKEPTQKDCDKCHRITEIINEGVRKNSLSDNQ